MKNRLFSNKWLIAGVMAGAVAGYVYWQQAGCNNGTCLITSNWHSSTAYGALMGGLLFSMLKKQKNGTGNQ